MSQGLNQLLAALRALKASNESGFEGLLRDLLEEVSGRQFRLLRSGPQGGKDILSEAEAALPTIAVEAKRFGASTALPADELKSKLREAIDTTPALDIWCVAVSRELKEPMWSELKAIGDEKGITILGLDWRKASGALPTLAALCAAGRNALSTRLAPSLASALDAIQQHPAYERTVGGIRKQLTAPEVGFDLMRRAARGWLDTAVQSPSEARRRLRGHADIRSKEARLVTRVAIEQKLTEWWAAKSAAPAVLLADEGRGKTWAALAWALKQAEAPDGPLVLVVSAKELHARNADEILTALLARCAPGITKENLARRVSRWCQGASWGTRILLLFDGLNEGWVAPWGDIFRSFDQSPWRSHVSLLATCRKTFWQDELLRLQGTTEKPVVEIDVPLFNELELAEYLATYGLQKGDFPSGLLKLISIPRFANLAVTLRDELRDEEDLTVGRMVLEDWRRRRQRDQVELRLDDNGLLKFVADLGREALKSSGFTVRRTQSEIYSRLSHATGDALDRYRNTINELVEGLWMTRADEAHHYTVVESRLPYAIALDLVRSLETHTSKDAINDTIAQYEEHLRGADISVAILRAATSFSVLQQRGTREARTALLQTWLRSQNFRGADFDELWPLVNFDPPLFCDFAEGYWQENPIATRESEVLSKALAKAAARPQTLEHLVQVLPRWVGCYGDDPVHWHTRGGVPRDEVRAAATRQNHQEWNRVSERYARDIRGHLHSAPSDLLPQAAFALMSYLPRAPFIEALVTYAVARAIMGVLLNIDRFEWLLRHNPLDHGDTESAVITEIQALTALGAPVASRAANILADALATPSAILLGNADAKVEAKEQPRKGGWPYLTDDGAIKWHPVAKPDGKDPSPIEWVRRLSPFAINPDSRLLPGNRKVLLAVVEQQKSPTGAAHIRLDDQGLAAPFARWTPDALGALVRRLYSTSFFRDDVPTTELTTGLAEATYLLDSKAKKAMRDAAERALSETGSETPKDRQSRSLWPVHSALAASLVGLAARSQIEHLKRLLPGFQFGPEIRALFSPPRTADVATVLNWMSRAQDDQVISAWLGYLSCVRLPALPANKTVLLTLTKHNVAAIRAVAMEIIANSEDEALGVSFADGGWRCVQGQDRREALIGTYLLGRYGKHISLDALRERIAPDTLAQTVAERGYADQEVQTLSEHLIVLLDAELSKKRRSSSFYPNPGDPKEAWKRAIHVNFAAVADRLREIGRKGGPIGFFDPLPLSEIVQAVMEKTPAEGVAIWESIRKEHRSGVTIGDFDLVPFHVGDHAEVLKLRRRVLNAADNDEMLSGIVMVALSNGHEKWLLDVIREDLESANAGCKARGLTVAGYLDQTDGSEALWRDKIDVEPLTGWLANVRAQARHCYQRNGRVTGRDSSWKPRVQRQRQAIYCYFIVPLTPGIHCG